MACRFKISNNSKKAIWEITNKCNYKCIYCIFNAGENNQQIELNTTECFHVIDELALNGFNELKITGGEPFVRKDLLDILEYASNKNILVDLSTNASLLNNVNLKRLKEINLKMIHISLDGLFFNNDILRGNNTYNKTIEGIKSLKESTNIYIRIGSLINKYNQNTQDLIDIVNVVEKLGVNEIIFSIMEPVGRMLGDNSKIYTRELSEIEKDIKNIKENNRNIKVSYNWDNQRNELKDCPAGEKFIYINNLGQIAPCTWLVTDNKELLSSNSLKNYSLNEILKEPIIKEFITNKANCCNAD